MSRVACAVPWIVALVTLSQLARPAPVHATPCPNLAFLIDRSNSMLNTMAGTPPMAGELSRWRVVRDAISMVLAQYDDKLPIGLALFPTPGSTCSTSSFTSSPTYGRQAAILATLDAAESLPGSMALTPTCGAVNALAADSPLKDPSRAQYIVLITDGKPLCQSSAGCTCDACGSLGAVNAAVESLRQARSQLPSIHTFVVGLGGSLDATEKQILNDMAAEGGEANPDPSVDYYPADTAAALSSQLAAILRTIAGTDASGGGSLACDDSCYSAGCLMGNACVQAVCRSNPCSSLRCDSGQYCYFDGKTASCLAPCTQSCDAGSRCVRGVCAVDACGAPCGAGQRCDVASKSCLPDPACSGVTCKLSQACQAGRCIDDPCRYGQCPDGFACVPFEGSCVPAGDGTAGRGCSCTMHRETAPSRALAALAPLVTACAVYLARRRRSRRALGASVAG